MVILKFSLVHRRIKCDPYWFAFWEDHNNDIGDSGRKQWRKRAIIFWRYRAVQNIVAVAQIEASKLCIYGEIQCVCICGYYVDEILLYQISRMLELCACSATTDASSSQAAQTPHSSQAAQMSHSSLAAQTSYSPSTPTSLARRAHLAGLAHLVTSLQFTLRTRNPSLAQLPPEVFAFYATCPLCGASEQAPNLRALICPKEHTFRMLSSRFYRKAHLGHPRCATWY